MTRLAGAAVLFVWGVSAFAQDITPLFYGRASVEAEGNPKSLNTSVDAGFDLSWGPVQGQILAGVSLREARLRWDWSSAWASVSSDAWRLQGGLWPDAPGPAQFRSLVPGFTAGSGTEYLATAGTAPAPVPFKISMSAAYNEWAWNGEVSPWRPEVPSPDVNSGWFPKKDIPTEVSGLIYPLGLVVVETPEERAHETLTRWPLKSEVRWSALWGEATLGVYHGSDTQVYFPLRLVLTTNLTDGSNRFDMHLRSESNPVTMVWATLQVPVGPTVFWSEQRWTKDRLRSEDGLDLEQGGEFALLRRSGRSAVWEGIAGGAWSASTAWGTFRFWGEASLYRDLDDGNRAAPDFTQGLVVGASYEMIRGEGRLDVLGGNAWDPTNGWAWFRATWNVNDGRSLWIGVPVFWGGSRTTWGQFSHQGTWVVGTTWQE